jgi:RNA polymerase sigma-70 factor (ECF subfamily)
LNDAELIRRIRERDETVLSELENKYGRRLGKVARNILKNEEDVPECLNDVYLKAWNSIPAAAPENLEAYLATLTRNTALNRVRDGNAQKRIPQGLILPLDEAVDNIRSDDRDETASIAESRSEEERIKAIINAFSEELTEKDQKVFVARYYYDASVNKIARYLGMPGGTVKSTLHRLRNELARRLREEGIEV